MAKYAIYERMIHGLGTVDGGANRRSRLALNFLAARAEDLHCQLCPSSSKADARVAMEEQPWQSWVQIWLGALASALKDGGERLRSGLASHHLATLFDLDRRIFPTLLNNLITSSAPQEELTNRKDGQPPQVLVPASLLKDCILAAASELQISALSLVIESKTPPHRSLPLNSTSSALSSLQFDHHQPRRKGELRGFFVKLLTRLRASTYALARDMAKITRIDEAERYPQEKEKLAAMQQSVDMSRDFLQWMVQLHHFAHLLDLILESGADPRFSNNGQQPKDGTKTLTKNAGMSLNKSKQVFSQEFPFAIDLVTPWLVKLLLACSESTYDDIQIRALTMLAAFPAPLAGLETAETAAHRILGRAAELLASTRDFESAAASKLIQLFHAASGRIECGSQAPGDSVVLVERDEGGQCPAWCLGGCFACVACTCAGQKKGAEPASASAGSEIWREIYSVQDIEAVGQRFNQWLTQVRHRGAFSTIYPAYCNAASAIPPQQWIIAFLDTVAQSGSQLSITRRSAGIGYAVLALVSAQPNKTDPSVLRNTVDRLMQIATQDASQQLEVMPVASIHALNISAGCRPRGRAQEGRGCTEDGVVPQPPFECLSNKVWKTWRLGESITANASKLLELNGCAITQSAFLEVVQDFIGIRQSAFLPVALQWPLMSDDRRRQLLDTCTRHLLLPRKMYASAVSKRSSVRMDRCPAAVLSTAPDRLASFVRKLQATVQDEEEGIWHAYTRPRCCTKSRSRPTPRVPWLQHVFADGSCVRKLRRSVKLWSTTCVPLREALLPYLSDLCKLLLSARPTAKDEQVVQCFSSGRGQSPSAPMSTHLSSRERLLSSVARTWVLLFPALGEESLSEREWQKETAEALFKAEIAAIDLLTDDDEDYVWKQLVPRRQPRANVRRRAGANTLLFAEKSPTNSATRKRRFVELRICRCATLDNAELAEMAKRTTPAWSVSMRRWPTGRVKVRPNQLAHAGCAAFAHHQILSARQCQDTALAARPIRSLPASVSISPSNRVPLS
ncbi:uncharacterized protein UTRI_02412 [Ustilago trichophora]|uniref:Uncharacterized protein n=1 Tax=Ustilago trichophora TaxID=86804 RepID=A0A5C3E999_9BASI|nr:uncharacterized protein UTRI_02412 [Ustilago trichophora]